MQYTDRQLEIMFTTPCRWPHACKFAHRAQCVSLINYLPSHGKWWRHHLLLIPALLGRNTKNVICHISSTRGPICMLPNDNSLHVCSDLDSICSTCNTLSLTCCRTVVENKPYQICVKYFVYEIKVINPQVQHQSGQISDSLGDKFFKQLIAMVEIVLKSKSKSDLSTL